MLKELGLYKQRILSPLYESDKIKDILLVNDYEKMDDEKIHAELKKRIYSHLFVDKTITNTDTYIYFDVLIPRVGSTIKNCKVIIYAFCHKDIIDSYSLKGYFGNRVDILAQVIEDIFSDESISRKFGIGKLSLSNVSIYNDERKFYGKILEFEVPNFR